MQQFSFVEHLTHEIRKLIDEDGLVNIKICPMNMEEVSRIAKNMGADQLK